MIIVKHEGDLHIFENVKWENEHHIITGHLYLESGGFLEIEKCLVELNSSYSREFCYRFRGGILKTTDTTIGGIFINGNVYQCNFEIDDGEWISENTTVQYTYGQIFLKHDSVGKITGNRHNAGIWSDSIIMTNKGEVKLENSIYPISLTMSCDDNQEIRDVAFDFITDKPINKVFDSKNVPGAGYSLELVDVTVPLWFLFIGNIKMNGKPTKVSIDKCDNIVLSFMGHNLTGKIELFEKPKLLYQRPASASDDSIRKSEYERLIKENSKIANKSIKIGNLELKIGSKPTIVWGFGIYCTGDETDLVFEGEKNICELIFDNGTIKLCGNPGTHNFFAQATTYEVGQNNGTGKLYIKNASIADFDYEFLGQITAWGDSCIYIEDCVIGKLKLMTKENGKIFVKNCKVKEILETRIEGGDIILENVTYN